MTSDLGSGYYGQLDLQQLDDLFRAAEALAAATAQAPVHEWDLGSAVRNIAGHQLEDVPGSRRSFALAALSHLLVYDQMDIPTIMGVVASHIVHRLRTTPGFPQFHRGPALP